MPPVNELSVLRIKREAPASTDQFVMQVGVVGGEPQPALVPVSLVTTGSAGRTILTANTNFYVAVGGSDSNPGTLAAPWATIQHAFNFISSLIDFGSMVVTINLSAGTFGSAFLEGTVGGGELHIIGAGSSSTTISDFSNDCIEILSTVTLVKFNKLRAEGGSLACINCSGPGSQVYLGSTNPANDLDVVLAPQAGGVYGFFVAQQANAAITTGTLTIDGVNGPGISAIGCFAQSNITDFSNWRFINSPNWSPGCFDVEFSSSYQNVNASFTGTNTGIPYFLLSQGTLTFNTGGNFVSGVGNTAGVIDTTSELSIGAIVGVGKTTKSGSPAITDLPSNTWAVFKNTAQPTGLGVTLDYNDAGTLVALNRQILTANTNFYVATTGNDSNPGTLASPWATLTHAMLFIANNIDIAGFVVTINVGSGSFAGLAFRSCVGGGIFQIVGVNAASTTITNGPNDGVQNFGECFDNTEVLGNTGFWIDALTASVDFSTGFSGGQGLLATYAQGNITIGNFLNGGPTTHPVTFKTAHGNTGVAVISATVGAIVTILQGTFTIIGDGSTLGAAFQAFTFAEVISYATIVFGAPVDTYGAIAAAFEAGFVFNAQGSLPTGSPLGPQATAQLGSAVTGPWPGSTATPVDNSSSYSPNSTKGVLGSNINYQTPLTGFSITLGNTDTQAILDPSGTLAAGTITMQAAPIDGHVVFIRTSQVITTLTISPNAGQSIKGYTAGTLALGGVLNAVYRAANSTWYF